MSSPEQQVYQEEIDINSNIDLAGRAFNLYCELSIASVLYIGLSAGHYYSAKSYLSQSDALSDLGFIGLAVSARGIFEIRQKIKGLKSLKAQEERFYRSLSRRHNPES